MKPLLELISKSIWSLISHNSYVGTSHQISFQSAKQGSNHWSSFSILVQARSIFDQQRATVFLTHHSSAIDKALASLAM